MKFYTFGLALLVSGGITFGNLKQAYGELIYEEDLNTQTAPVKAEQADSALSNLAPNTDSGVVGSDQANPSKTELMRRHRVREELKNEDLLTQKLEELRLKDEMKRSEKISNDLSGINKSENIVPTQAATLEEKRVGAAGLNAEAVSGPAVSVSSPQQQPILVNPVGINGAPVQAGPTNASEAEIQEIEKPKNLRVSITPRGGISGIMGSIYDVESKYSFGVGLGVDLSEHFTAVAGYSYSTYTLGAASTLAYPYGFNTAFLQRLNLNDNVVDAGIRAYILNTSAKARPFVGAGFAYRRGYVNYDGATKDYLRRFAAYDGQDVSISGFAGYIEAGLEFKLTSAISLSAAFKYFNMFSSRQSNPIHPNAFLGPNAYGYGYPYAGANYYGYNNDIRARTGDALSRDNLFQLMGGVSISF